LSTEEFNLDNELRMNKLKEELAKSYSQYRKNIEYMSCDISIGALCLPKLIEKKLSDNGILRVYDLIGLDFAKIEFLGTIEIGNLTTGFNKFVAML